MNSEINNMNLYYRQTECMVCGEPYVALDPSCGKGKCPVCGRDVETIHPDPYKGSEVFINLTPHTINVVMVQVQVSIPPSGVIARVEMKEDEGKSIGLTGIPCITRLPGSVVGLPEPSWQTKIVSGMVLEHCAGRNDVVAPDTGETAIRNEKGHIQAVTRFVRPRGVK